MHVTLSNIVVQTGELICLLILIDFGTQFVVQRKIMELNLVRCDLHLVCWHTIVPQISNPRVTLDGVIGGAVRLLNGRFGRKRVTLDILLY